MAPRPLDDIDRRIVAALRADGRMSMRALAAALHISRASAYNRVERLQGDGVITGYAATIDPQLYGYGLSAYVYLDIAQQSWKTLRDRVLRMPEVEHGALVSGEHDIVLLVRARDMASLRELVLTRLQEMPEVRSTETVLIFDELASRPYGGPSASRPYGDTGPGSAASGPAGSGPAGSGPAGSGPAGSGPVGS